jgi:acyl dehydratase
MRYFEDIRPGDVVEFGSYEVTRDEILDFARRYDPQSFHVDDRAARESPFGGLIASGWHTAAIFMRLYVDAVLSGSASMGSPGVEELRWLHPVRPGDVLSGRTRVVAASPSDKRPDRGTVISETEIVNQDGEVVMTMRARGFFRRRST